MEYTKWVTIFGNAVSISENRVEGYAKNITLRYPISLPFDGDQIKISFDNFCGTEDITISKATLLYEDKFYTLTFQGQESGIVPCGQKVTTDVLSCDIKNNSSAYVSIFLKDYTQMRSSVFVSGPLSEGIYAIGDEANNKQISINTSKKTNIYYFLSDVELHTSDANRTIICFGDSITAQAWPDYLNLRCMEKGHPAVAIRRAASGSRLLRQYECITYESYGLSGHNRYQHEFPASGADTIIIQQGINDIIHPVGEEVNIFRPMSDLPTVKEMTDELLIYINHAHELGYKVYLGTLLPIEGWRTYADFREKMRMEYNDWIRTNKFADGYIDFDQAVCNPKNPKAFADGYDSGDHLHPSLEGYKAMANAVPIELLK